VAYSSDNYLKHTHPNLLYQCSTLHFMHRLYRLLDKTGAQSVLEIGSGEGFVLDYLVKRQPGLAYTGTDLNWEAVQMARRISAPGTAYACAHGALMPFPDRCFDVVLLSEVLEHVPAPEAVLAEALRLSRAYLLVTVPLEPLFQSLSRLLIWLKAGRDPGHINFWSGPAFKRWLGCQVDLIHHERCELYQLALCRRLD